MKPSSHRVAQKWVQSAIFQAPPAVVDDIYRWGMRILCARWLNRLPEKRAAVHSKIEEAREDQDNWKIGFHENRLLNLKLAEAKALKWMGGENPRSYANWRQYNMLEPDFTGWRYLQEIEQRTGSTPEELLKGKAERTYTIKLQEQKIKLGGHWNYRDYLMFLTLSFDPHDVNTFKIKARDFRSLVVHETAHLGQSYFQLLLGLGEGKAGFPSRSLAEPGYTPLGMPLGKTGPIEEHALREVEFYTRLQDEISSFMDKIPRIPLESRREVLKVWVGATKPPGGRLLFRPAPRVMPVVVRTSTFFEVLRDQSKPKWRKAVSEFIKEIEQRVEIPR